jgi:hypothetical protein
VVDLDIKVIPQESKVLGRQMVHDPRSRNFARTARIDRSKWVDKTIRIYDPLRNPDQCHGECVGCAKCMQFNAAGNRVKGVVLKMDDAHALYSGATNNDPFDWTWPPLDLGSSGLGSCIAAQKLGLGGEYRHIFNGADGIVQAIQENEVVSIGTWWTQNMFYPDARGVIEPTGVRVGGHQYVGRGYLVKGDFVKIRCWWGSYRDVLIKRDHLNDIVLQDGDAHTQKRLI